MIVQYDIINIYNKNETFYNLSLNIYILLESDIFKKNSVSFLNKFSQNY